MLHLQNVNKAYLLPDSTVLPVLKQMNLSFADGELVAILGKSGCGKSTLLNVLGGLDNEYEGEIMFDDVPLKARDLDNYRLEDVGFIFQSFQLIPHLSLLDNVLLAFNKQKLSQSEKVATAKQLLTDVGLGEYINKKVTMLSGGQKQRVAIARALANNPKIILADEPTGALDSKTADVVFELLQKIAASGKLVLIVTHNRELANRCQRIVELDYGNVKSDTQVAAFESVTRAKPPLTFKKRLSVLASIGLGIKNIRYRLGRTAFLSVASAIAIASVVLTLSLGGAVQTNIREAFVSGADLLAFQISSVNDGFDEADLATLAETYEIRTGFGLAIADPSFVIAGQTQRIPIEEDPNSFSFASLFGGDYQTVAPFLNIPSQYELVEGVFPAWDDVSNIAISEQTAAEFDLAVGDEVVLNGFYVNPVASLKGDAVNMPAVTISGIFFDEVGSQPLIFSDQLSEQLAKASLNTDDLNLASMSGVAKDEAQIQTIIDDYGANDEYRVVTSATTLQTVDTIFATIRVVLTAIASISLIVACAMIGIVMFVNVIERKKEIGILKAIGYQKAEIRRIFFTEASITGLIGGIAGISVSGGIAFVANNISQQLYALNIIDITTLIIGVALLVAILIGGIGGLFPAIKASKVDPIESLRS
ncbi:MAG: ATP-binding cassette domain-containing protein [Culicoidibacterales bacterium]